jgi:hypothetical protein
VGQRAVGLRIGPVGVAFRATRARDRRWIRAFFRPFLARPAAGFWTIALAPAGAPAAKAVRPRVETLPGGRFRVVSRRFEAELSTQARSGIVRLATPAVLGTFLRAFLGHVLPQNNGLLLHSAGWSRRGRAFLFPGRSGAGKSTLARMCPRAEVLSDEIVLVQRRRGGWRAWGTPFHGDLACGRPRPAPLKGLFFPAKSRTWRLSRLPAPEGARRLLRCVLSFDSDRPSYDALLGAASDLARSARSYELSFARALPPGRGLAALLN